MPAAGPQRTIRSFVLRQGRITRGQRTAFIRLMPRYGLDPAHGAFDFTSSFSRAARRTLEIGFGNGEMLLALARAQPGEDFIGIEVHRPGIGRLLLALDAEQLANVRVVCADAVEVLQRCVPDASLDAVLLFFPDPWPKKRHHKRRLVQAEFIALLAQKLKSGGRLQLATDWPDYAAQMLAVLNNSPAFSNCAADGGYAPRPAQRPPTKFERRGVALGHPVRDLAFVRR
ncbi:MAG TPA: tRNA (guanosine(46)-N7)-methyltransferase TrmB, partial [Gammaproteobacteria bacterium]|nr:tRNA (guanosine(46)-N7)-methyltransferase TrmB [Gammaproteobacteria bacterium]